MTASQPTTQQDAITLLTTDHQEVEQLFGQLESQPPGPSQDEPVREVIRELSGHAAIEEQVLYPAMRSALPDGDALVEEALQEHQQVKEALAAIERSDSPNARDALLRQLMADVRHHVDEEEGELFPKLREAVGPEGLQDLGEKLAAAKKMAPTHPHPNAPNTPPGNIVGGAGAAVVDKVRDALRGS